MLYLGHLLLSEGLSIHSPDSVTLSQILGVWVFILLPIPLLSASTFLRVPCLICDSWDKTVETCHALTSVSPASSSFCNTQAVRLDCLGEGLLLETQTLPLPSSPPSFSVLPPLLWAGTTAQLTGPLSGPRDHSSENARCHWL